MLETVAGGVDSLQTKLAVYIILGIVAIMIISVLLDGVRKYIRGLDTAALGAIFLWLGYEATGNPLFRSLSGLLLLIGGTLFVTGIVLFIIIMLIKRKRAEKRNLAIQREETARQREEAARQREEAARHMKETVEPSDQGEIKL